MKCIDLIPSPTKFTLGEGRFAVTSETTISFDSPAAEHVAGLFAEQFYRTFAVQLEVNSVREERRGSVVFQTGESGVGPEAYTVKITSTGATLRAREAAGLFYAGQSLLQLFDADSGTLPIASIEDQPRFGWRGMMLDSARFFQPVSWIKKWIDLLALHKYNVFHWHLTEDQGWRIEIKKYPELARTSAWRNKSRAGHEIAAAGFDDKPHGGFYTQSDLRELVAYAAERNITIVPEIEMPGHAEAALAAYPHLSCTGGPFEVSPRWGVHKEVYCAGNDDVFTFLEDVLEEVLAVFPSTFIHIGGDECPKDRWKECPKCQARIRTEGLADEHELQSWFMRRMDDFLSARGRRLIGWDEILEGGLAPGAAVMSWRGEEGGIAAAQAGHDVVMAANQEVYFDYYQSEDRTNEPLAIGAYLPLQVVYKHEPIPAALNEEEAAHILGGQGQLWTEYMPRTDNVEYMAFPRACALAEVLWSDVENRDLECFSARLRRHLKLLDRLGVNYRPSDQRGRKP